MNFTVDDSANRVFDAGELQWQVSAEYDASTWTATFLEDGGSHRLPLFDDGPWNGGGHEPLGAVAGDGRWGMSIFTVPLATARTWNSSLWDDGNWLYQTSFDVPPGLTADLDAGSWTLPAFGTTTFRLFLDTHALADAGSWDSSQVRVFGSCWRFVEVRLFDDGTRGDALVNDGVFTFDLDSNTGPNTLLPHDGRPPTGAVCEFYFKLGAAKYQDDAGNAYLAGVSAQVRSGPSLRWVDAGVSSGGWVTTIVIP